MANKTRTKATAEKDTFHRFHTAFEATAAARAALAQDELLPINLDVRIALTTVLGVLPRLLGLRDAIAESLPTFDATPLDALGDYAEALAYAQSGFLAASGPEKALPALAARASQIRAQLTSDAAALAQRGLLDGRRLSELKGTTGYLNIASDVGVLVRILRERWRDIDHKSAIEPQELDEAEQMFERMTTAYAARASRPLTVAAALEDRRRAYTLLVRAYDQARRAVTYLRWTEGDADAIAPSLWAGRGRRRARSKPRNGVNVTGAAGSEAPSAEGRAIASGASVTTEPKEAPVPGAAPITTH